MSAKDEVLKVFNLYPSLINGFTIRQIAKLARLPYHQVKNVIVRFKRQGKLKVLKPSKGKGRGKGKTLAVYAFKKQGKQYLKAKGNRYVL
jgi:transposase